MTWFRVGGAGIPASLKNAMNAVFNKKFGTSGQNYPPKQWPDEVNLLGPLPEGTATGPIANFSDGADDVPVKSCIAALPASISGYTEASVLKTGKNLFDGYTKGYGVNSSTGEIFTNNNGAISGYIPIKPNTAFYVSGLTDTIHSFVAYYKADKTYISRMTGTNRTYVSATTPSECYYVIVYQYANNDVGTVDDVDNLQTQLEIGSSPSSYEPYQTPSTYAALLGRLIHGGSSDLVNGTGTADCSAPIALSSLSWNKTTIGGHDCFYANLPDGYIGAEGLLGDCDSYDITTDGQMGTDSTIRFYNSTSFNFSRVSIRDDQYASYTGAQFKQAVTGNIVYQLAESARTDFTFDGQEINSLYGVNNFWNDAGGDTTVVYRRDIELVLQTVSSSRGLMMASRPVTQLVGEESDPDQVNELVEDFVPYCERYEDIHDCEGGEQGLCNQCIHWITERIKHEQEGEDDAR